MKRQIIIEFDDEQQMKCPNGPDGESGVFSITPDEVKTIYKNCYKIADKLLPPIVPRLNNCGSIAFNTSSNRLNTVRECVHNILTIMHEVEERN